MPKDFRIMIPLTWLFRLIARRLGLIACLLIAANAQAADFGCGRDTDRNGSVDRFCSGDDADTDMFTTAQGDCDDNNFDVFPGVSTGSGCSAGEWRTCKQDGSGWTACTSAVFCPNSDTLKPYPDMDAVSSCVYFNDATGSNSTGDGSSGNPYQDLRKISSGYSGSTGFTCGKAYIVRGGTYDQFYTSGNVYHFNSGTSTDCTKAAPLLIQCYPGETCVFDTGTAYPSTVVPPFVTSTNRVYLRGFEIGYGYGSGMDFQDSARHTRVSLSYIHHREGNGNNNLAGIRLDQGTDGIVHHNYIGDLWATTGNVGNVTGIDWYKNDYTTSDWISAGVANTVVKGSHGPTTAYRKKHCALYETVFPWVGNFAYGVDYAGNDCGAGSWERNLFLQTKGFGFSDNGGRTYMGPQAVDNNTVVVPSTGTQAVSISPVLSYNTDGSAAADACSGNYLEDFTFTNNVLVSERATMNQEQRILSTSPYINDLQRTAFLSKLHTVTNLYYNTNGLTTLFGFAESNNGSTGCSGYGSNGTSYDLAAFQAAGFDSGSYVENPSFDSSHIATSTNSNGKGWRGASGQGWGSDGWSTLRIDAPEVAGITSVSALSKFKGLRW